MGRADLARGLEPRLGRGSGVHPGRLIQEHEGPEVPHVRVQKDHALRPAVRGVSAHHPR